MRRPQTMKAVVIGIGICCSVSCAGPVEEMTVDLQRVRAKCGAPDASDFFFPAGMFRQRDDATKALRREYSAMLSSTGQPSLSCGNSPQMGYRVIRIPHMPREPVVIRITRSGEQTDVVVDDSTGAVAGSATGSRSRHAQRASETDWRQLTTVLDRMDFWSTPQFQVRPEQYGVPLHATTWILEGRDGERYHVVIRGLHEIQPEAVETFRLFFKIAGIPPPSELAN